MNSLQPKSESDNYAVIYCQEGNCVDSGMHNAPLQMTVARTVDVIKDSRLSIQKAFQKPHVTVGQSASGCSANLFIEFTKKVSQFILKKLTVIITAR